MAEKQTRVFDDITESFGRPFTEQECWVKLQSNIRWKKERKYLRSCIRDRKKKGMIIDAPGGFLELTERGRLKNEMDEGISPQERASLSLSFDWGPEEFEGEFGGTYANFFRERMIGITDIFLEDSDRESLLKYAIEKSYGAATGGAAFNTIVENGEKRKEAKKVVAEYLLREVQNVGESELDDFDTWHNKVCEALCNKLAPIKDKKGHNAWSYGNSQKILNLTLKYIVLMTKRLRTIDAGHQFVLFGQKYLDRIEKLHLPVDRYIIGALKAWGLKGHEVSLPQEQSWSKWGEKDYKNYLPTVKALLKFGVSPIVWETVIWPKAKKLKLGYGGHIDP